MKPVNPELQAEIDRINLMTGDEAVAYIHTLTGQITEKMILLTTAWARAQKMGKDLSALHVGILKHVPAVIEGKVLPETISMFHNLTSVLNLVAALPVDDQRKVVQAEKFPFAVRENGKTTFRKYAVQELKTVNQIKQLIGDGAIRSEAEQAAILDAEVKEATAMKPGPTVTHGKVMVDTKTQTVRIGKNSAPATEVIAALVKAGMIEAPPKLVKAA